MKKTSLVMALVLAQLAITTLIHAQSPTPSPVPTEVRDGLYGEVVPLITGLTNDTGVVFVTWGWSTFTTNQWDAMTSNDIISAYNQQYNANATDVIINGPRHWLMDYITNNVINPGLNTNLLTVDGILFGEQATLNLPPGTTGSIPYTQQIVSRTTTYTYLSNTLVYQLIDPYGNTYVGQTYSDMVDTNLTLSEMQYIGPKLNLPTGWTYQSVTLTNDLQLIAQGSATVTQDYFLNTYQLIPNAAPEPSTYALFGLGAIGMLMVLRRKRTA